MVKIPPHLIQKPHWERYCLLKVCWGKRKNLHFTIFSLSIQTQFNICKFFSFCNGVIIYEQHFPGAQTLLPKNVKWGFKLSHCAGFQRTFLKIKNPLNELVCLGKLPPQIVEMELISISSFLNYLLPVEYIFAWVHSSCKCCWSIE